MISAFRSILNMIAILFIAYNLSNLSYSFFFKDGTWNMEPQKTVKLGVLPVRSLLVMEDTIWAACGGQIFIISTVTHFIEVTCLKLWKW